MHLKETFEGPECDCVQMLVLHDQAVPFKSNPQKKHEKSKHSEDEQSVTH